MGPCEYRITSLCLIWYYVFIKCNTQSSTTYFSSFHLVPVSLSTNPPVSVPNVKNCLVFHSEELFYCKLVSELSLLPHSMY